MHDAHDVLRAPKTPPPVVRPGSLAEPAPQRSDRSLRRSSGETPLLGVPSLADPLAEASDGRTLRFLLTKEEEDPEGCREACDSDGDLLWWCDTKVEDADGDGRDGLVAAAEDDPHFYWLICCEGLLWRPEVSARCGTRESYLAFKLTFT